MTLGWTVPLNADRPVMRCRTRLIQVSARPARVPIIHLKRCPPTLLLLVRAVLFCAVSSSMFIPLHSFLIGMAGWSRSESRSV